MSDYNGWTNYETWAVNLHLDNGESSQDYWREAAREAYDSAEADEMFTRADKASFGLADRLKSEHEEACPEIDGVFGDLLNAALSDVNWDEIARHWVAAALEVST